MLNVLFPQTSAYWARYSEYEYREHRGELFLLPVAGAKPSVYDVIKEADHLVVDALNIGMMCMQQNPRERDIRAEILTFAAKYGLLGIITALPTTPEFIDYNAVYLPKNPILKAETMSVTEYIDLFFPFDKPRFRHKGGEADWSVHNDRTMLGLMLAFENKPVAMSMALQRGYAERYAWIRAQLKDLAFSFCASIFFYEEGTGEEVRDLHQKAMEAFGGIAPQYRIVLTKQKPMIIWDFHSLWQTLQMVFSFALTDEEKPLRCCPHCTKVFIAEDAGIVFCSPTCENEYHIAQSKKRKGRWGRWW